ncbi:UDP-glycosyltransferase 73C4-like [Impatiens glandulifera]|uniref:UDP-glycosyltransferase 73C4-like n=1 Tax=Impatiens glandulifera TaxID=253017 RepID=UPI001FB0D7ED|nr:UDP-glycosyltransferase 73C4-like [Impatiens glandulifera]
MAVSSSSSHETPLHIVFVPMLAPGHFIPMIDLAKLIATRGVKATVFITPVISARYGQSLRPESDSIPIRFIEIPFLSGEVGLPEGCETVDTLSFTLWSNFQSALSKWQTSVEHFIKEIEPFPTCMISDRYIPQIAVNAERLGLRRFIFDGMGCLSILIAYEIQTSKIHKTVEESEPFMLPGLPDIGLTRKQLPIHVRSNSPSMTEYREQMRAADSRACGILINSFDELEPDYITELRKLHQNRAWCVGPMSLHNKEKSEVARRGNKSSIDENECLKWLDNQESGSVIYSCLGSMSNIAPQQIAELGLALEASNRPFIWVLRKTETKADIEKWLSENKFVERTLGRGLVIWGWAPQVLILSHKAVGAFLMHCGWNSVMEGICSGIPMITWPNGGEQFFNEKLVSQILGIGVSVGPKSLLSVFPSEQTEVQIKSETILEAIEKVMSGDHQGLQRRKLVRELAEAAKKSSEKGGSSHRNIALFLQYIATNQNHA